MLSGEVETREDLIKRFAYNFWQIRSRCGLAGDEKKDYFDAIEAVNSYEKLHCGRER